MATVSSAWTPEQTTGTPGAGHVAGSAEVTVAPIIIDLGKKKAKQIKELKRGSGKLMDEVAEVLNRVHGNLGPDADLRNLIPVVMLYSKKPKRLKRMLPLSF